MRIVGSRSKVHAVVIAGVLSCAITALPSPSAPGSTTASSQSFVGEEAASQAAADGRPAVRPVSQPAKRVTRAASAVPHARRRAAPTSAAWLTSFARSFPAQAAAFEDPSDRASNHWAVLIGINDYRGSNNDLIGSYQDARDLRAYLLSLGWRSDHIALLGNRAATRDRILQAIRWLALKTNERSVVVFHYSGHEQPRHSLSDGDSERRDVAIWAADDRLVLDGALGRELGRVRAAQMWIDMATCRAGGFSDAGMNKPGRVLTYSAPESELSYENPAWKHSIFGWFAIVEGMTRGMADVDGSGDVTVEEAFFYASPLVTQLTKDRQHPAIVDLLEGDLALAPPPPPNRSRRASGPSEPPKKADACGFPCLP